MNVAEQRAKSNVIIARGNEPWFKRLNTLGIAMQLSRWTTEEEYLLTKAPLTLLSQFESGRNVIILEIHPDGVATLIGYATFYHLGVDRHGTDYWELGTVVVDKHRREQHFGTVLYDAVEELHDELGGVLIGTTKSEKVYQIGLRHGLELHDFRRLDHRIRHGLCYDVPCFTPHDEYPSDCVRQHTMGGDCKLRCRVT